MDTHLRTWLSYSSQKSCVKICFGLVDPFKSYCVNKQKKQKQDEASQLQPAWTVGVQGEGAGEVGGRMEWG